MNIKGKKDVAKNISKYILLEFITIAIISNLHNIVEILCRKINLPEVVISNTLNVIDISGGLIGFAISSVLAVMCINNLRYYYKNRGEHELNSSVINRQVRYTTDNEEIIRNKLVESSLMENKSEDFSENYKIQISGIEEIKTQKDIDYHKKLNSSK